MKILNFDDYNSKSSINENLIEERYHPNDMFKDALRLFVPWGLLWNFYLAYNKIQRVQKLVDNETDPKKRNELRKKLEDLSRTEVKAIEKIQDAKVKNAEKLKNADEDQRKKYKEKGEKIANKLKQQISKK